MVIVSKSLRIIEKDVVENWKKRDPYSVVEKFGKIIAWDNMEIEMYLIKQ